MSGGHSKSKTQTRELNATERADLFNAGKALIGNSWNPRFQSYGGSYTSGVVSPTSAAGTTATSFKGKGGFDPISFGMAGLGEKKLFGKAVSPGDGMGNAAIPNSGLYFPEYQQSGFTEAGYTDPGAFTGPGNAKTLSGGDYDRLERSIVGSRWAPLMRSKELDREALNQSLADRGIYSSGLAVESENDLAERYAPQFAAAGAEAAAQRYGLQAQELQGLNQYNLSSSDMANQYRLNTANMANQYAANEAARRTAFDQQQADQIYRSNWAPLEYLQNLWSGTKGSLSATNQYSQNFGF